LSHQGIRPVAFLFFDGGRGLGYPVGLLGDAASSVYRLYPPLILQGPGTSGDNRCFVSDPVLSPSCRGHTKATSEKHTVLHRSYLHRAWQWSAAGGAMCPYVPVRHCAAWSARLPLLSCLTPCWRRAVSEARSRGVANPLRSSLHAANPRSCLLGPWGLDAEASTSWAVRLLKCIHI
jgi:hypothetical protein